MLRRSLNSVIQLTFIVTSSPRKLQLFQNSVHCIQFCGEFLHYRVRELLTFDCWASLDSWYSITKHIIHLFFWIYLRTNCCKQTLLQITCCLHLWAQASYSDTSYVFTVNNTWTTTTPFLLLMPKFCLYIKSVHTFLNEGRITLFITKVFRCVWLEVLFQSYPCH